MSVLAPLLDNLPACSVMYFENCDDVANEFYGLLKTHKEVDAIGSINAVDDLTIFQAVNFASNDRVDDDYEGDDQKLLPKDEWKYITFTCNVSESDVNDYKNNVPLATFLNAAKTEKMIIMITSNQSLSGSNFQILKDRVSIRVFKNANGDVETESFDVPDFVPIQHPEQPMVRPTCIQGSFSTVSNEQDC